MDRFDLASATDTLAALVRGVRPDQLDGPTPCPELPVAALVEHIAGLSLAFTAAATKDFTLLEQSAPATDRATGIPEALDALAAAWRDPAAWEGMTKAGGVDLPAEICALVALDEVVIHGWDLAVATGQPFAVDPALLELVNGFVATFEPDGDVQLFGPRVEVGANAPLLEKTLGLTGRNPTWTP